MKEKDFQKKVVKLLRDQGGIIFNVHGHAMQAAGWPDLYIALPASGANGDWQGWLELKTKKNKATALQEHRIKQLHKVGCPAAVLRLLEWPLCQIELSNSLLDYGRLFECLGEIRGTKDT